MGDFEGFARLLGLVALGKLGWSAEEYWQATPAELRMALQGRLAAAPGEPVRSVDLERLLKEFPDG